MTLFQPENAWLSVQLLMHGWRIRCKVSLLSTKYFQDIPHFVKFICVENMTSHCVQLCIIVVLALYRATMNEQ